MDAFSQPPPQLGNQYDDDRVLRSLLARRFGGHTPPAVTEILREMGALAGDEPPRPRARASTCSPASSRMTPLC